VGADDGCSIENGGDESGDGGGFARGDWSGLALVERSEGVAEEGFAAESGEEGATEGEEFGLTGEEREILVEAFAESVAGIEDHCVGWDSGLGSGGEACS